MDYIIQQVNTSAYTSLTCPEFAEYLNYYSKIVYSVFGIGRWWPPNNCTEPEFLGIVEGYRICTTPIVIAVFIFWNILAGIRCGWKYTFGTFAMCLLLSLKPAYIEVQADNFTNSMLRILTLANLLWGMLFWWSRAQFQIFENRIKK